jgi:hypothetical protein
MIGEDHHTMNVAHNAAGSKKESAAVVADIIRRLITDRPHQWNRPLVAEACEQLRATVLAAEWKGKAGRTDRLVMLIALDFAQWGKRLDVKLPARTVALNVGVSPITASRSLRRLCKAGWLIRMDCLVREWTEAITYLVSPLQIDPVPTRRHLYKMYSPARVSPGGSNPSAALGVTVHQMCSEWAQRTMAGQDSDAVRAALEDKYSSRISALTLKEKNKDDTVTPTHEIGKTYTDGVWARALNLAQSELGVLLGNTAIAVMLVLTDEPMRERDIARTAGVSFKGAVNCLRRLAMHGLAIREQGADGRFRYRAGMAPEEYALDPDPGLLRNRRRIVERQRAEHYRRASVRYYGYPSKHDDNAADSARDDAPRLV